GSGPPAGCRHRRGVGGGGGGHGGRRRHHPGGGRQADGREGARGATREDWSKRMKVVLAYSGGLDTSVIVAWLKEEYGAEVYCYTADVGQGEEVDEAVAKAFATGAADARAEDLRLEFVRDAVF